MPDDGQSTGTEARHGTVGRVTSHRATGPQHSREDGATAGPAAVDAEVARVQHRADKHGSVAAWLRETAIIVVSALVLSLLIKTFLVQAFFIPSGSMENTLLEGDRVLVTKLAPGPLEVHRGDVVVFKDPGGWLQTGQAVAQPAWREAVTSALTFIGLLPQDSGEHLIKRVIGLAGDTVECCDDEGRLLVNGEPLDEPYLAPGALPSELDFSVVVPEGSLWVMGDNRQNSQDSRYHQGEPGGGSIPGENVVGVAFVTVWPVDRWQVLRNPGSTFAEVPEPQAGD